MKIAIYKMISRLQPVAHFREHLESLKWQFDNKIVLKLII